MNPKLHGGLYNMVMGGHNPNAALCLLMIGVDLEKVDRFRDAWLSDDGQRVVVLTRTGGSNVVLTRTDSSNRREYSAGNAYLRALPGYVEDHDDPLDGTYAHWTYEVPAEFRSDCVVVAKFTARLGRGAEHSGPKGMLRWMEGEFPVKMPKGTPEEQELLRQAMEATNRMYRVLAARTAEGNGDAG